MTALDQPAVARQAGEPPRELGGLPPGPARMPRIVQTAGFAFGGTRFLEWCRRRYGPAVLLRTVFDEGFVMVFEPALVKQVFQGGGAQLHAGEANVLLGPILGERSVLLLDGAEHLRHRRLLLAPFHGERLRAFAEIIREAADREIESWPVGREFVLLESMQALTLSVIVRAVFGYRPGPESEELIRRLLAMIEPLARPRGLILMGLASRLGPLVAPLRRLRRGPDPMQRFRGRQRAVDELLYAEIARRRRDSELEQRDDVFSTLLCARDEDGRLLSDREVRDELLTLLLAGHETTATALAWTFDLLLHTPDVLELALCADERYLDAVAKEALRLRPVIPAVGRVVRGEPFELGDYRIPVGFEINPSIRTIHARADLYPQPRAFRPERFLVEDPPDTYTWLPFGGGTRRCLGASFALMEMRIVLGRVLERAGRRLQATSPKLERAHLRTITLGPRHGVRVRLDPAGADRRPMG
jgi:cytochrome P450